MLVGGCPTRCLHHLGVRNSAADGCTVGSLTSCYARQHPVGCLSCADWVLVSGKSHAVSCNNSCSLTCCSGCLCARANSWLQCRLIDIRDINHAAVHSVHNGQHLCFIIFLHSHRLCCMCYARSSLLRQMLGQPARCCPCPKGECGAHAGLATDDQAAIDSCRSWAQSGDLCPGLPGCHRYEGDSHGHDGAAVPATLCQAAGADQLLAGQQARASRSRACPTHSGAPPLL